MSGGMDTGFDNNHVATEKKSNGVTPFDLIEDIDNGNTPAEKKCRDCLEESGAKICPRKL
jgi:hypothetical protein